jgi:hypothetical protein
MGWEDCTAADYGTTDCTHCGDECQYDEDCAAAASSTTSTASSTSSVVSCIGSNTYQYLPIYPTPLVLGNTYRFEGWGRTCEGPAGQGVRLALKLDIKPTGILTWIEQTSSAPSEHDAAAVNYCGSLDPNTDGWYYNYTIPTSYPTGPYTFRSRHYNDSTCYHTASQAVMITMPTPTSYHLACDATTLQCQRAPNPGPDYCGQQYPVTGTYEGDMCEDQFIDYDFNLN